MVGARRLQTNKQKSDHAVFCVVDAAVVERCKLLEIQYLMKELHQHQVPAVHAQHDVNAQQPQQVQQQQVQPQQLLPEHQQVWGAAGDGIIAQQPPLCRRLSVRVVLQRLPAAPVPDEQQESAAAEGGSWQQRGLQGWGQVQQVSYTCALEYPAHTLRVRARVRYSSVRQACPRHACGSFACLHV